MARQVQHAFTPYGAGAGVSAGAGAKFNYETYYSKFPRLRHPNAIVESPNYASLYPMQVGTNFYASGVLCRTDRIEKT